MHPVHYDLIVIGSGPAGQKGAIAAAKLGNRVAMVDRNDMVGGVCIHGGTVPSKTLREAILHLTGFRHRSFYGNDYVVKAKISIRDLAARVTQVVERETGVVRDQLRRNGIDLLCGVAQFVDPKTLEVQSPTETHLLHAENILIACGTRPTHPHDIPFDGKKILASDQFFQMDEIPRELIIVGGGVIGLEYASMLVAMGVEVTLIEQRPTLLDFVDAEIVEALRYHMRRQGAIFRLGEKVTAIETDERGRVVANLESGKRIHAASLMYAVGRQANTDLLNLEAAGLTAGSRGKLEVNERFQTSVPHIYAAGDVIGFPSLASTSMEQGRLASCQIFGAPAEMSHALLPYGIYTIPEISMVGKTESTLTDSHIPFEVGISKYEELAKAQIVGDHTGMLKILFHPDTRKVLGVHVIGENAAEIIHIGQAVLTFGGTMDYFRDTVFNYPTFAEAYKVAGLDGLNKL
ncbi:MAG TPA: Si-specific NAD(P)(+) transhydrogenase [Candidatus Dormibacteraeota bacterium]|nr:Si-specific NAD(P)(+) transhydrogenase [Candidatus Dormibacteraeota bacterium]